MIYLFQLFGSLMSLIFFDSPYLMCYAVVTSHMCSFHVRVQQVYMRFMQRVRPSCLDLMYPSVEPQSLMYIKGGRKPGREARIYIWIFHFGVHLKRAAERKVFKSNDARNTGV